MDNLEYIKQLEDLTYLPSREEIIQQCKKWLYHIFMDTYDRSKNVLEHEFVTKELIEWLTNHVIASYPHEQKVDILEIYAGNGKLAYHMQKSLQEKCWDMFTYRAVDNWDDTRKNTSSLVQNMNHTQWIDIYKPDIIFASRLPFHPYNMLPKWFQETLYALSFDRHLRNLTEEQKIEYDDMNKIYWSAERGNDITHYRRQNTKIQEYILIGNTSSTWDKEKTYGYTGAYFSDADYKRYGKEDLENLRMQKNPLFQQDWFLRQELDIPTMNRYNSMCGFQDVKDNSQVFSFKRQK